MEDKYNITKAMVNRLRKKVLIGYNSKKMYGVRRKLDQTYREIVKLVDKYRPAIILFNQGTFYQDCADAINVNRTSFYHALHRIKIAAPHLVVRELPLEDPYLREACLSLTL